MKVINNNNFYDKCIREHGISAKGVHWKNDASQKIRFEILTSFIKDNSYNKTILDIGCGFSDYYSYLIDENISFKSYEGVDSYYKMIDISQNTFNDVKFYHLNILNDKLFSRDIFLCSGALNLLNKNDTFIFIEKCYEYTNETFVFNYLNKNNISNLSMKEVVTFCKSICKNVSLKNDYLDNDFSLCLKK